MYRRRLAFTLAMAALAAILLPSSLRAQITFQRTYGGADYDIGKSVQQTTDGGYIIAGYTTSFGSGGVDVYLIKTDAVGDTIWTRASDDNAAPDPEPPPKLPIGNRQSQMARARGFDMTPPGG